MGYRSDVAIAIYGEKGQMAAFIAATRLQENVAEVFNECEIYPYLSTAFDPNNDTPMVMLTAEFSDVKWYDGYPDVDRWNRFIVLAGEENEDTEYQFNGPDVHFCLGVRREISVDLPQKVQPMAGLV